MAARLLKSFARVDLLILDDWSLAPMTIERRPDLLEIIEDRHARGSAIVTSQLPVERTIAHRRFHHRRHYLLGIPA